MARLQKNKRFLKEDFDPKNASLIDKIGIIFNNFAEELYDAFQGNINFDNLNQAIAQITTKVVSGVPSVDLKFKSLINGSIQGIACIKAENLTNTSTYPTSQPFLSYTEDSGIVTVQNISGLQDNNNYRLTLIIIGN
jgi:hypothetical protein